MKPFVFKCKNLNLNSVNQVSRGQLSVKLVHQKDDPENSNRITVSIEDFEVEILPSKGLSIGQAWNNKKPIFWEPIIGMPDPDLLDLNSEEIAINGKPHTGFTFLKTFNGGVELYGLKNWGMPRVDKNGKLLPIHGETSNIPVDEVVVSFNEKEKKIEIMAEFFYNSYEGDTDTLWYLRGERLIKIIRHVVVKYESEATIELYDTFENVSSSSFFVDWGYHMTFAPEKGARIIIPSKSVENRSNEDLPKDIESWHPAAKPQIRTEVGIIHKNLKKYADKGVVINKVLIERPNLGNLLVSFRPAPYMQSWMCNGGAYSSEFTFAETNSPLFHKNWDGIGIEIGASALDHDENTDPSVPLVKSLEPKEKYTNYLSIKVIDSNTSIDIKKDFSEYSINNSQWSKL